MNTREVALTSTLSALSLVLLLSPLFFPFPPLPFLKFDIGEMPIFLLALMIGTKASALASLIVGALVTFREGNPVGAFFKTLAMISNVVSFSILRRRNLYAASFISSIVRACIMTIADYLLIPVLYTPGISVEEVARFFGLTLWEFLAFIAIFNIAQGLLNSLLAVYVYQKLPADLKAVFGGLEHERSHA